MTIRSQREFLKVQLLEMERLREGVAGHPIMSLALAEREEELKQQIAMLPLGGKEAKAVLLFSGEPVFGSHGIDVTFASRVLEPFQSMVMADYADRFHGVVGTRGRLSGEADSRLLLTALPRGSFGMELSRAESDELFEEDQLADTLTHLTRLVEASARSDEDFAVELQETAPRVIQRLKVFLEVIAKGKAGLQLESGDARCSMSPVGAEEAFNRVAGTITNDEELKLPGVFRGALLNSWKFDFVKDDEHKISGKLEENLTVEAVEALSRSFLNRRCMACVLKTTVLFRNGRIRTSYVLTNLEPVV
jgi:hypothetical protein